jgi:hypothetical protein
VVKKSQETGDYRKNRKADSEDSNQTVEIDARCNQKATETKGKHRQRKDSIANTASMMQNDRLDCSADRCDYQYAQQYCNQQVHPYIMEGLFANQTQYIPVQADRPPHLSNVPFQTPYHFSSHSGYIPTHLPMHHNPNLHTISHADYHAQPRVHHCGNDNKSSSDQDEFPDASAPPLDAMNSLSNAQPPNVHFPVPNCYLYDPPLNPHPYHFLPPFIPYVGAFQHNIPWWTTGFVESHYKGYPNRENKMLSSKAIICNPLNEILALDLERADSAVRSRKTASSNKSEHLELIMPKDPHYSHRNVYIKQLPAEISTEEDLLNLCRPFGKVVSIRFIKHPVSANRAYAFALVN